MARSSEEVFYCNSCLREVDPDEEETGFLKQGNFGDYNPPDCPYCGKQLQYYESKVLKKSNRGTVNQMRQRNGVTDLEAKLSV
ncbi:MAG: hypothetical protein V1839_01400 [archaeon]